jgi:hypothetical protein
MYKYATSGNSDVSYFCLSQMKHSQHDSSYFQQFQIRSPIIRGFSKDSISVYVRSSDPSPATSPPTYSRVSCQRRAREVSTTFIVGTEGSSTCSDSQTDVSSSHRHPHHNDVFEDSDDEYTSEDVSKDIEDVEWEDEDDISHDEDTQLFNRVSTPPLIRSSKSSLTSLIRSDQESQTDFSSPVRNTNLHVAKSAVIDARECRRHMFKTEFAGSLPNHMCWERRMSDQRVQASFQDLSCQTEAVISQKWNQALDSQLWAIHW